MREPLKLGSTLKTIPLREEDRSIELTFTCPEHGGRVTNTNPKAIRLNGTATVLVYCQFCHKFFHFDEIVEVE